MVAKGRGGGKTPDKVKELLIKAVSDSSQAAVARKTGLTRQTIQRYMEGIGEPSTATLQKLADCFNVPVPYLRGDIEAFGNSLDEFYTDLIEKLNGEGLDNFDPTVHIKKIDAALAKCGMSEAEAKKYMIEMFSSLITEIQKTQQAAQNQT